MKSVLDILTENLTNERLDHILQQNVSYQEITDKVSKAFHDLEKIDSDKKETQKIIDEYDSTMHEQFALVIKLSYQQGMKDIVQLLLSLT